MQSKIKIPLRIPNAKRPDRYFSFRLQDGLNYERCIYKAPTILFVISCIEGNFDAFYRLLVRNGIIDRHFGWKFGEGHLVVLGNCFERNEPTTECLWFLYSLEQKAKMEGGHVHFILGHHEIIHLNGEWKNTHPPYALSTSKTSSPFTALYDANHELHRWLGTKNLVEKIGELLFLHSGILEIMRNTNHSISDINTLAHSFFNRLTSISDCKLSDALFNSNKITVQNFPSSKESFTEEQVNAILTKFNVKTVVTGHNPQEKISSFFNGNVINVATDHTKDNSQGLLIMRGMFYRTDRHGRKEKINT